MVTWDRVAELALDLPEVTQTTSYGRPAFAVCGKTFAGASRHEGALFVRCDPDERPLLVAAKPEAHRLTPHFEPAREYLLVWLEHADESDARERLLDAWLLRAPKRLVAERVVDGGRP